MSPINNAPTLSAISLNLVAITLEVRVGNLKAQSLYEKFGFAPAGVRPNYYSDTSEDALIMWLSDLSDQKVIEIVESTINRLDIQKV